LTVVAEFKSPAFGRPVAFVRTSADGVPSAGVTRVGDVESTVFPLPVLVVTPVPPWFTGNAEDKCVMVTWFEESMSPPVMMAVPVPAGMVNVLVPRPVPVTGCRVTVPDMVLPNVILPSDIVGIPSAIAVLKPRVPVPFVLITASFAADPGMA
jgi:hypothetical protein